MSQTDRFKLRGIRSVIAKNMRASLANSAQLTLFSEFDATDLLSTKNKMKAAGAGIGIEDIVGVAVCRALDKHSALRSRLEDRQVQLSDQTDLCFAIATDAGLMAPTVFNAGTMELAELSATRKDLTLRAKNNNLTKEELVGGNFTISNLGLTPVTHFTPIIKQPQVAIPGIGTITERAVLAPRGPTSHPAMHLSLTTDHQLIDGLPGGLFPGDLQDLLENCEPWVLKDHSASGQDS